MCPHLHGRLAVGAEQRLHPLVNLDAQQDALVLQLLHQRLAVVQLLEQRLLVQDLQAKDRQQVCLLNVSQDTVAWPCVSAV